MNDAFARGIMCQFTGQFKKYPQDVIDLRDEAFCRLPPAAKTTQEEVAFKSMMSEFPSPVPGVNLLTPNPAHDYAPYLRMIGLQLLRLDVPRHASINVPFSEASQIDSRGDTMTEVTVSTQHGVILNGYLVITFNIPPSGIQTDFGSFVDAHDMITNEDLVQYLTNHSSARALRIERGHPLGPENPAHLQVSPGILVASAKVFDE